MITVSQPIWWVAPSAGFAGAIRFLGEASEGAVEALSEALAPSE